MPPQAYTREVLAQAYAWLQSQNENVKSMAQSPDSLVTLYLRAKRNGDTFEETPVSAENFRSQLKTLASEIQQFVPERERGAANIHQPSPPPPYFAPTTSNESFATAPPPVYPPPPPPAYNPPSSHSYAPTVSTTSHSTSTNYDPRSLEMLQKVKNQLNLSSDQEAMRMLLVLGFEKFQSLFGERP